MAPPDRPRRAPRNPQKARPPFKRREEGEAKPYQRQKDSPAKPYARRDDRGGPKKPDARRDDRDGAKKPYQRRDDRPPRRDAPPARAERPAPKGWGGVTRRGARQVTFPTPASEEAKAYERRAGSRAPRPEVDRWERDARPAPAKAKAPGKPAKKGPPPRTKALPPDVVAEVASAAGNPRRAPMLQKRLGEAAKHIQQGRDRDAANILRQLSQEVPEAASVRELYGQALYGLGRYKQAVHEFEAFVDLTHSTDQHPMLADSYRALGRHKKVQELWAELREASPSPDLVAEGRIVAAGSLADQGKLQDAVKLLETAPPVRGRVAERHMRTWYALADLYERCGENARARSLFLRVVQHEADFADAADRLRALA